MIVLLTDMAIVKSGKDYDNKVIKEKGILPSDYVFKKNDVDSAVYEANNAWYAAHPKIYLEIFNAVGDSLEAKNQVLINIRKERDSIKKATDSTGLKKDSITKMKRVIPKLIEKKLIK